MFICHELYRILCYPITYCLEETTHCLYSGMIVAQTYTGTCEMYSKAMYFCRCAIPFLI